MSLKAEILERRIDENGATLLCRVFDDNPAAPLELGEVEVPDGDGPSVKIALRREASRMAGLSVGRILDLS